MKAGPLLARARQLIEFSIAHDDLQSWFAMKSISPSVRPSVRASAEQMNRNGDERRIETSVLHGIESFLQAWHRGCVIDGLKVHSDLITNSFVHCNRPLPGCPRFHSALAWPPPPPSKLIPRRQPLFDNADSACSLSRRSIDICSRIPKFVRLNAAQEWHTYRK